MLLIKMPSHWYAVSLPFEFANLCWEIGLGETEKLVIVYSTKQKDRLIRHLSSRVAGLL